MLVDILLFLLGIVLIIAGANYLTEGASTLARRMGLSPLVVGLTIVAFGTSAPELIVSLMSALKGNADIAMGNVIGSNIFNILAIGGVTAVVAPITITKSTIRREIPLMLLSFLVLFFLSYDTIFAGTAGTTENTPLPSLAPHPLHRGWACSIGLWRRSIRLFSLEHSTHLRDERELHRPDDRRCGDFSSGACHFRSCST